MRQALIAVFVLVVGSTVLGTTVFREPLADAAGGIPSILVANKPSEPVPVQEQNLDANGDIKVHEQGVANVNVNGVVTTQAAEPAHSFSLAEAGGVSIREGCTEFLPAGTRWFITSFAVANLSGVEAVTRLIAVEEVTGLLAYGPEVAVHAYETVQLTFPQPFVLTSPVDGACLWRASTNQAVEVTVVGYRL